MVFNDDLQDGCAPALVFDPRVIIFELKFTFVICELVASPTMKYKVRTNSPAEL